MRCDLHVHSIASGMFDGPGLSWLCRESYSDPAALYYQLKQTGMSLVTVTDHDSIDAAEALRRYPDFFLSEEVTVIMPSGTKMHLGVYGISERDHTEIQRRRGDFMALVRYLRERNLFFSVNHVFSGLTGRREVDDFRRFAAHVPAFEVRNGHMWPEANAGAEKLARLLGKVAVGGSDSHTLASAGHTYTEVPGARSAEEFIAGLRAGHGWIRGLHGSYGTVTANAYRVARGLLLDRPWTIALTPLLPFLPVFTAAHWANEIRFCRKWRGMLESGSKGPRRWGIGSKLQPKLAG
jgi:predicted metal-dependent phosphoesterase TrpH